jgi:ribosomal protein S18 acetylase RimI-like enzyme
MKLVRATDNHVLAIMEWFPDRLSCQLWGGPEFRFPFTEATFLEDTRSRELPSYVLVDVDERLLGFGQYYLRVGRCHLARLVISPEHRGEGLGRWLIGGLVELGAQHLGVGECSLFVAEDNPSAIQLYRKLGFVRTQYPEDDPRVTPYPYMVVSRAKLVEWELGAQQRAASDP